MPVDGNTVNIRPKSRPYHHGDLRGALLAAAAELCRSGGPDAVVLREVVRRVGVSPTAAYRHFRDREDLLAAVRAEAHRSLVERMSQRIEPLRGYPDRERAAAVFRTLGASYVLFALEEPGLFRAAFTGPVEQLKDDDAPTPMTLLSASLDELVQQGRLSAVSRPGLDEVTWAVLHGLAMLLLDEQLPPAHATAVREHRPGNVLDQLLDVTLDGLLRTLPGHTR